ncbi:hypothetical protein SUDANB37_02744 [Streptomyces sp. enrichment culture]
MKPLKRPARRTLLVTHVAVSVSWLGLSLGLLALGITAYTTQDASLTRAAYRAMEVFAEWLLAPVALVTLASGLVLSLGTPWGLARHYWVWTKFWLTLVTAAATVYALRPEIARGGERGAGQQSGRRAPRLHQRLSLHDGALRAQTLGADPPRPPTARRAPGAS